MALVGEREGEGDTLGEHWRVAAGYRVECSGEGGVECRLER